MFRSGSTRRPRTRASTSTSSTRDSDRIRYKKVNERTGKEVEAANIVKGVDLGGGST